MCRWIWRILFYALPHIFLICPASQECTFLGAPFPVAGSMFLLTSFCRSAKYLALLLFERIDLGTNYWLVLV